MQMGHMGYSRDEMLLVGLGLVKRDCLRIVYVGLDSPTALDF